MAFTFVGLTNVELAGAADILSCGLILNRMLSVIAFLTGAAFYPNTRELPARDELITVCPQLTEC